MMTARLPGADAVAVDIGLRGATASMHARPVVVGEDQRPLDGAGRQHDLGGAQRHRRWRVDGRLADGGSGDRRPAPPALT